MPKLSEFQEATNGENTQIVAVQGPAGGPYTDVLMDASLFDFSNIPTSDPRVAGRLWNNGGVVCISAG